MMESDQLISQIKDRLTISAVIQRLGYPFELKRSTQKSPFREDMNGKSFHVFDNDTKCFDFAQWDKPKDVIDVIEMHYGIEFVEALKIAQDMAGLGEFESRPLWSKPLGQQRPKAVRTLPEEIECRRISCFDNAVAEFARIKQMDQPVRKKGWEWAINEGALRRVHFKNLDAQHSWAHGMLCWYMGRRDIQVRSDLQSSRGDRWISQSDEVRPLGYSPGELRPIVFITEGGTDYVSLSGIIQWIGLDASVIGRPGTSWRPSPAMAYDIGIGKDVYVIADNDATAGAANAQLISEMINELSVPRSCTVFPAAWVSDGKDLSDCDINVAATLIYNHFMKQ